MCGIFGYTGTQKAAPLLVGGLRLLEYRGYDSAGLYIPGGQCVKVVGGAEELEAQVVDPAPASKGGTGKSGATSGIGHLRWATHGEPTKTNAHPHTSCNSDVWVVHNGIIENFQTLKEMLEEKGHTFVSDTDTEVIAHLIEHYCEQTDTFEAAVQKALRSLEGTYGLAVAHTAEPEKIIVARMGAPIVIGVGDGEHFVASDPSPILRHTKDVVYLRDGEMAILTPGEHHIKTHTNQTVKRQIEKIEWELEHIQKDGYEHFMMKEIMEGPSVIEDTTRGRLIEEEGLAKLGGLEDVAGALRTVDRLVIVACGTAYYAGLVGEYMLEEYAGVPVEVEVASEFRYRTPILNEKTAVLAISQSGETADTLEAVREAKRKGALTLGIVNVVGSTIARETDAGIYNHAGPEISVASTKAFISQLAALSLLTLFLGRQRGLSMVMGRRIVEELEALPQKIERVLATEPDIKAVAEKYADTEHMLFIGRKYNYPIAYEGALKLKEVSYIHAEGYGAGELKHGPLALINETLPTVAIAPRDSVYEKMVSNIQEIRARKGPIVAITTEGNTELDALCSDVLYVPKTLEMLSPILTAIPLQLLAYHIACTRGCNVDRPRNLAKSVTVE